MSNLDDTVDSASGGGKHAGREQVAVLGYGPEARAQAIRLRDAGHAVTVTVRPGGASWIRAVADGFRPKPAGEAISAASVVVVHVPEAEQGALYGQSIAPNLTAGTLVVFARGSAVHSGSIEPAAGVDVVLVTARDQPCRVAVHQDATGRALDRAAAFARAAFGDGAVGTTTFALETRADIVELVARMGGVHALLAEWDRVLDSPGHEPDEATLAYYDRLRAMVVNDSVPTSIPTPPASTVVATEAPSGAFRTFRGERGVA